MEKVDELERENALYEQRLLTLNQTLDRLGRKALLSSGGSLKEVGKN